MILLATIVGCAHDAKPPAPASFEPVATEQAPPRAALYADCVGQAIANRSYRRAHDGDTNLLLFTCTGDPARAFYDALGPWSAQIGSEARHAGRTIRSTQKVRKDLFGVDYCAAAGAEVECSVSLNAGPFLGP
jgi:hypothetical protein